MRIIVFSDPTDRTARPGAGRAGAPRAVVFKRQNGGGGGHFERKKVEKGGKGRESAVFNES